MPLRPLHESLAEDLAATDGDLRLHDLVAVIHRVAFRVEEGFDPFALVVLEQKFPADEHTGEADAGEDAQRRPAQPHEQGHGHEDDRADERRAQVRLHQDEDKGDRGQDDRPDQVAQPVAARDLNAGVGMGKHQNEDQLGRLRGLQAEKAEVDPALRAGDGFDKKEGVEQQEQDNDVEHVADLDHPLVLLGHEHQDQNHAGGEEGQLLDENGRGPGIGAVGGTVEIHQRHGGHQEQHEQHHPVEMLQQSSVELHHSGPFTGSFGCGAGSLTAPLSASSPS